VEETWRIEGDRFADSFNPRHAIISDTGRIGYLKVLGGNYAEDPWVEQWANEQIISELARTLGLPAVEARAGSVEGQRGAIVTFANGRKLSELEAQGFRVAPLLDAALNRHQFGLIVAFDVWTLNVDRGAHNLFIPVEQGRPVLNLIDHGHTLLLPRESKHADPAPADWEEFVASGVLEDASMTQLVLSSYLRPYAAPEDIKGGVETITRVGDDVIEGVVDAVSDEFLCCPRPAMIRLLINRRDELARCLEEAL
jgi:hypothetical protein